MAPAPWSLTMQRLASPIRSALALSISIAGCSTPGPNGPAPTWHQGVAPLVHEHCVDCHRTDGAAPFSLETYEQARSWAAAMRAQVEAGAMPPWGALDTEECTHPTPFKHDPRLDESERELLTRWVESGTPEGDPEDAWPLPDPGALDLDAPDGMYSAPGEFVVEGTEDQFWCTSIDPALDQDVWLTGLQLRPGAPEVVHHALFYVDAAGASADLGDDDGYYECFGAAGVSEATLVGGYIPGAQPLRPPPETGIPLPAGARIIVSFHYHPTLSGPVADRSALALTWTEDRPRLEAGFELVGNAPDAASGLLPGPGDPDGEPVFRIPANASDHVERMVWEVPELGGDAFLWSITNHMHYLGVDQLTTVKHADGTEGCLLHTPRWDFDWQRVYELGGPASELPRLVPGDRLQLRCTYDNSMANPALARLLKERDLDAPVDVELGDRSFDEMCIAAISYAHAP